MSYVGVLWVYVQCFGSGTAMIRIHFSVLDPDRILMGNAVPDPGAWKLTNLQVNLVSCLSKRLLYLRGYVF